MLLNGMMINYTVWKFLFYILTIKQACLHHQALTSKEVWITLQRWAKHKSHAHFVNRQIDIFL